MKKTALFIAALALAACDGGAEEESDERVAAFDAEDDSVDDEFRGRGHRGMRRHHGKRGNPSDRVCELVSCSDDQVERVEAAFGSSHRGERPDMSAANAALSQAFAGEGFAQADLDAWASQMPERSDRHLDALSELHAILTPEQRKTLGAEIASGRFLGGKRKGPGSQHEGEGDRQRRMLERVCRPLACSEEQEAQLTTIFGKVRTEAPDPAAKREQVAAAFASETFDADAVADLVSERRETMHATILAVHASLTPEQRAILAESIAEHGPRALMGKGGHHGKRGRHGKRGQHRRGGRDHDLGAESQDFG